MNQTPISYDVQYLELFNQKNHCILAVDKCKAFCNRLNFLQCIIHNTCLKENIHFMFTSVHTTIISKMGGPFHI